MPTKRAKNKTPAPARIEEFRGDYRFLSNFAFAPFTYEGHFYTCVEVAYQASKTNDLDWKLRIRHTERPGLAKRMGRECPMREDWDEVKNDIMLELVRLKFASGKAIKQMLLDTGDAELVEGNNWGDTYWGVCKGVGENHLGRILMQVREELREGATC